MFKKNLEKLQSAASEYMKYPHLSTRKIANKYNVTPSTLRQYLIYIGKWRWRNAPKLSEQQEQELISLSFTPITIEELGKTFNCSHTTVVTTLRKHFGNNYKEHRKNLNGRKVQEELQILLTNGLNYHQIMKHLNISYDTLRKYLVNLGLTKQEINKLFEITIVCVNCNKKFKAHKNTKTCSPTCASEYIKLKSYKMNKATYESLLIKQNGKCAICGNGEGERLVIDHSHNTNNVRGILCNSCNVALGMFRDNINLLYSAINYLKE